jgi:hypothetical protein
MELARFSAFDISDINVMMGELIRSNQSHCATAVEERKELKSTVISETRGLSCFTILLITKIRFRV